MSWRQQRRHARFSELTNEKETQRAFMFDADAARERYESQLKDWPLRKDFRDYWVTRGEYDDAKWCVFRKRFAERGLSLPRYPGEGPILIPLLDTLYSAAEGRPIGWGYDDLVKIAHDVFDRYKGYLWVFKLMLAAHGRGPQIKAEDVTGKWRSVKVKEYREGWAKGDASFAPDRRFDSLVQFLFPEIANDLPSRPE